LSLAIEKLSMRPTSASFGPVCDQRSKPLTARAVVPPPKLPVFHADSHVEPVAVPTRLSFAS
jgi:hypothetical protein